MSVVGGTVNNGKVTLPDGQDGPIVVLDTQTGDKIYVRTDDITGAGVRCKGTWSRHRTVLDRRRQCSKSRLATQ